MSGTSDIAYRHLVAALQRGEFLPGSRLPGERDLAIRLGVSRVTIRRALGRLEDEGRLQRSAQRGWFVDGAVLGEVPSTLQSFSEMAASKGLRPTAKVLVQQVRPATLDEADQLRIAPGAPVLELRRLRGMDGHPICVDLVVLRLRGVEPLVDADLTDRSLYECLESMCGVRLLRSTYSVQAHAASLEIAGLLNCEPGSPILVASETAYASDGQAVLIGVNRYRGDAYRFTTELSRPL